VGVDHLDSRDLVGDDLGQSAGGDDPGRAHLLLEASDQPFNQPGVAVEDARLEGLDGVAADRRPGLGQFDPVEAGGPFEEGLGGDQQPGGDGAAQVVAVAVDGVEGGGGAEVDDDGRPAVAVVGGQGVGDAVGPDLLGVLIENADAGPDARADNQRLQAEVGPAEIGESGGKGRHHAADDHRPDRRQPQAVVGQDLVDQHGVLVGHALRGGGRPPGAHQPVLLIGAEDDVGVADVDGQQHGARIIAQALARDLSGTGREGVAHAPPPVDRLASPDRSPRPSASPGAAGP
jgi:hypothetical protein